MTESVAVPSRGQNGSWAQYAPALVWLSILSLGAVVQWASAGRLAAWTVTATAAASVLQVGAAASLFAVLPRRRLLVPGMLAAALAIAPAPLLIPADARVLRFVTGCASVILLLKVWDLHVHVRSGRRITWPEFIAFVVHPLAIVLRKQEEKKAPSRPEVLADLWWALAGVAVSGGAVGGLFLVRWREVPLLAEHAVKAVVILSAFLYWIHAMTAIVRLNGGKMIDFADAPLLARTPADFWRRYNRVLNQYFHEDVFKPAGGRRHPAAATMLVFALSAAIHEYVFALGIGRVQGFQTAFFLLQGAAVAATLRVRPRRRMAVVGWTAATLMFNTLTSLLFFQSFHALVPLYANPLPQWLQR